MAYGRYGRSTRRYSTRRRRYRSYTPRSTYKRSYSRPRKSYRKKSSSKRYGKRDSSGACVCPGELSPAERFLLAQADPFEPRALGAKIPDSSTQPSVAIPCQELYSQLGAATGNVYCTAFLPSVTNSIVVPGGIAAGAWTWAAAFGNGSSWNKATDISSSCEAIRPVAHGIRMSSNQSPTTAAGYVHLALAVETIKPTDTTWQYATTIGQMSGYSWYKRVTIASLTQTPLTIINKYVDETAFRYLAPESPAASGSTTSNTFQIPLSWGALLVAVEGHAAANPLQFEMILHLEAIPKNTGVLSGSSAAAYAPSILASASSISSQTDFAHTEDQQDSYMAQAAANAQAGATAAGNAFMQNVINPAARNIGYSLANQAIGMAITGAAGIAGVNANPHRLEYNR